MRAQAGMYTKANAHAKVDIQAHCQQWFWHSAWRTVMEILDREGLEEKAEELISNWGGPIDDVDMGWYDFNTIGWTEYGVQPGIVKPVPT